MLKLCQRPKSKDEGRYMVDYPHGNLCFVSSAEGLVKSARQNLIVALGADAKPSTQWKTHACLCFLQL